MAKRTQKEIRDRVAEVQPLENGKPLKVSERNIGGGVLSRSHKRFDRLLDRKDKVLLAKI